MSDDCLSVTMPVSLGGIQPEPENIGKKNPNGATAFAVEKVPANSTFVNEQWRTGDLM